MNTTMKQMLKILHLLIIVSATSTLALAQPIVFSGESILGGTSLSHYEDIEGKLNVETVRNFAGFTQSDDETPNFGNTKNSIWIKFAITNQSPQDRIYMELAHPYWDTCNLYTYTDRGMELVNEFSSQQPFFTRSLDHVNPSFILSQAIGSTQTYYLKLNASDQAIVPILFYYNKGFLDSVLLREILYGLLFGILVSMMLYNLFIYFSVKEQTYLYYVGYLLFTVLTQATLFGYSFKYLWPHAPQFNHHAFIIFPAFVGYFGIMFARSFLHSKVNNPWLDTAIQSGFIIYTAAIVFRLLGQDYLSYRMVDIGGITVAVLGFVIALKQAMKGNRPARFFLIAWSVFIVGLILFALRNLNVLPYNNVTNYTLQMGTAIEVLLLSIALADKINELKKQQAKSQQEALLSQAEALRVSKENQRIISQQNIILEKKVSERTKELKEANQVLENTLTQLREAQTQLIDSEKMASLGQLTAGIAHEINNPINFVCSNINPLKRNFQDVLDLMNSYDDLDKVATPEEAKEILNRIKAVKDDIDFEYTKDEIGQLLNGMKEGAERTVEIVRGLKIFSRLDNQGLNTANLNEGIESTLVLLNNQIQPKVKLIKELGNLPDVQCYPGKMNQVFMNIITNAIHAVKDDKMTNTPPTIWVTSTLEDENHIKICIRDNGPGIPEHVRPKIFEPFFTTKDVGKGTGLGLSICFSIIEAHGGSIHVDTEIGKGTEFKITLPVKQI